MGENSAIEWCHHTFNPWTGCTRVSAGCDNCYAAALAKRNPAAFGSWEPGAPRKRTSEANWHQPLVWNRKAAREGKSARVFCASMADVFDNQVPAEWRRDLWHLIRETPNLDWLLLTKRPQNIAQMLPTLENGGPCVWGSGWPNVWLGTTAENQAEADRRIPHLLSVPAAKRFLSCEPLLGPVDLRRVCILPHKAGSLRAGIHIDALTARYVESGMPYVGEWDITGPCPPASDARCIDWVISGGESGPGARPSHSDWHRSLRDQCAAAGVPFFFKQWGEWAPVGYVDRGAATDHAEFAWEKLGKKAAGALLDGREHREVPHA